MDILNVSVTKTINKIIIINICECYLKYLLALISNTDLCYTTFTKNNVKFNVTAFCLLYHTEWHWVLSVCISILHSMYCVYYCCTSTISWELL